MPNNTALGGCPAELRARGQWVVWRTETRDNKPTKIPYRPDAPRVRAEVDAPRTWGTFNQAVAIPDVDGVGFVFSEDDPYCGIDLDGCVNPETGELHPAAAEIIEQLDSYSEVSPSGTGYHIIVKAELRCDRHSTKKTAWGGKFEIYDRLRYFTVTGKGWIPISPRQEQVDALVAQLLPAKEKANGNGNGHHVETDGDLLQRMFGARNGRDIEALYRSSGGDDPSADDLALCNHLAFWFQTPARIDAVFRGSGRMRGKWDERHGGDGRTYGQMTIDTALAGRTEFYTPTVNGNGKTNGNGKHSDPAAEISARWGILNDPIERGETRGDIATGDAIIYLYQRSGRRLRFPSLLDLYDAGKHTALASGATRARFDRLNPKEATRITQAIIELCGGDDLDPTEETREWVIEFIAGAGSTVYALRADGTAKSQWDVLEEYEQAELSLDTRGNDIARGSVIIRKDEEIWLPCGRLKAFSGSRISWRQFDNRMIEIGWRKHELDVREPGTREQRASKLKARRVHRKFYAGTD